jgi:hypothetical protein
MDCSRLRELSLNSHHSAIASFPHAFFGGLFDLHSSKSFLSLTIYFGICLTLVKVVLASLASLGLTTVFLERMTDETGRALCLEAIRICLPIDPAESYLCINGRYLSLAMLAVQILPGPPPSASNVACAWPSSDSACTSRGSHLRVAGNSVADIHASAHGQAPLPDMACLTLFGKANDATEHAQYAVRDTLALTSTTRNILAPRSKSGAASSRTVALVIVTMLMPQQASPLLLRENEYRLKLALHVGAHLADRTLAPRVTLHLPNSNETMDLAYSFVGTLDGQLVAGLSQQGPHKLVKGMLYCMEAVGKDSKYLPASGSDLHSAVPFRPLRRLYEAGGTMTVFLEFDSGVWITLRLIFGAVQCLPRSGNADCCWPRAIESSRNCSVGQFR